MQNMPPSFFEQLLKKAGVVIDNTPLLVIEPQQNQIWDDLIEKLVSKK